MAKRPYSKAHTAKGTPRRYLLSGIPPTLWAKARAKAAKEGIAMRSLILTLLEQWLERKPETAHQVAHRLLETWMSEDRQANPDHCELIVKEQGEPLETIGDAVLRTLQQIKGESEPHTIGMEAPTVENDPVGRFRQATVQQGFPPQGRDMIGAIKMEILKMTQQTPFPGRECGKDSA